MEENLIETEISDVQFDEPTDVDNSNFEQMEYDYPEIEDERQSQDRSEDFILGKFKNVDELAKAYSELQKYQGQSSQELGKLRQESNSVQNFTNSLIDMLDFSKQMSNGLAEIREKYNSPEYFQDDKFRSLYKEAFMALGDNLDSDKFIELLESYVNSRLALNEKNKLAEQETQKVLDSMSYSENSKSTFTPPKKSLDEMTQKEIDELLDRLI